MISNGRLCWCIAKPSDPRYDVHCTVYTSYCNLSLYCTLQGGQPFASRSQIQLELQRAQYKMYGKIQGIRAKFGSGATGWQPLLSLQGCPDSRPRLSSQIWCLGLIFWRFNFILLIDFYMIGITGNTVKMEFSTFCKNKYKSQFIIHPRPSPAPAYWWNDD